MISLFLDTSSSNLNVGVLKNKELLKEKVEMYNFNPKVIEKIINIYGPEVKLK